MISKSFAVLGDPIAHSLSPKIHQAAFRFLGLNYGYQAIQVPKFGLANFVSSNHEAFNGFSITMPLKFEAAAITSEERLFGAGVANTLVRTETGWTSHNTDVAGLRFALSECFASSPRSAAVLGSGATARSALVALANEQIIDITVYARDANSANLSEFGRQLGIELNLKNLAEYRNGQDLTLNTLPSGVAEVLSNAGEQSGWLLSANYAETDQQFTGLFEESRVVPGSEMLLGQAVEQIQLFVADELDFAKVNQQDLLAAMRAAL